MGLVLSLIGGIVIILDAIAALVIGDALAGIIGIIFSILILIFAFMGYIAKEKETAMISGLLVMIIGFIVMIASVALMSPFEFILIVIAIIGGFLATMGGILTVPRK